MSLVQDLPGTAALFAMASELCLAAALIGCMLMLIASAMVAFFRSEPAPACSTEPPVTVLKPLHGEEPDISERLKAFCSQDYGAPVQILCGVQDSSAPAVADVRALQREIPGCALDLHVDPRQQGCNRKLSNLINMLPRLRYDTLVLSDSDIVVSPDYLRTASGLLARPGVGAATFLYYGIAKGGFWARLSALAINSSFLPQAIMAIGLRMTKPCFGATIAIRRPVLDQIGGFGRFVDDLADDYAIGMAVRDAGYEVVVAPFPVGHECFENSFRQFVRHQMRVARTIKSIEPLGYAGSVVTFPLPLALIGLLSGSDSAMIIAAAALLTRFLVCRCVERRFALPQENLWLVPLQDCIAFGVYVASFFGATVHWRDSEYRVATDGTLIEQDLRRT